MAEKTKITFEYKIPEDYNPTYVNGAYGGVGQMGEIIVNFYLERQLIPKSSTYDITEDGSLSLDTEIDYKNLKSKAIRFIETGLILNIDSAKRIYTWLGEKIEESEKIHRIQNKK